MTSPHKQHTPRSGLSHSSAARVLGTSVDPYDDDEVDSGSSDEEAAHAALSDSIVNEVRLSHPALCSTLLIQPDMML